MKNCRVHPTHWLISTQVVAFREAARVDARIGALAHSCALFYRVLERVGARTGDLRSVDDAIRIRQGGGAGLVRVAEARADAVALGLALRLRKAQLVLAVDLVATPAVATARAGLGNRCVLVRVNLVGRRRRAGREREDEGSFAGHISLVGAALSVNWAAVLARNSRIAHIGSEYGSPRAELKLMESRPRAEAYHTCFQYK